MHTPVEKMAIRKERSTQLHLILYLVSFFEWYSVGFSSPLFGGVGDWKRRRYRGKEGHLSLQSLHSLPSSLISIFGSVLRYQSNPLYNKCMRALFFVAFTPLPFCSLPSHISPSKDVCGEMHKKARGGKANKSISQSQLLLQIKSSVSLLSSCLFYSTPPPYFPP